MTELLKESVLAAVLTLAAWAFVYIVLTLEPIMHWNPV